MTSGIHHVTAITRDVQRNVDFYMGFLGLRLVKQTGGFGDAEQLHLFYGDRLGSSGSVYLPEDPDGTVIVLLHATGGNEADLMPMAARLDPRATLLGVRGRFTEESVARWFRRMNAGTYDQADIRVKSAAFASFIGGVVRGYGLDPAQLPFLGYSNGANLLGATLRLHPGTISRVILLRGIEVLEDAPEPDLTGTRVLLLSGADIPTRPWRPRSKRR